jgi:hypothetical protein
MLNDVPEPVEAFATVIPVVEVVVLNVVLPVAAKFDNGVPEPPLPNDPFEYPAL